MSLATPAPIRTSSPWSMALDTDASLGLGTVQVSERVRHAAQIVLIVAMALVLISGIVAFSLVAYQCIKHGYNHVAAYGPNGWRLWQMRIVCQK